MGKLTSLLVIVCCFCAVATCAAVFVLCMIGLSNVNEFNILPSIIGSIGSVTGFVVSFLKMLEFVGN